MPKQIPVISTKPLLRNLLDFRADRLGLLMRVSQKCGDFGVFHLGRTKKILGSQT
jgi:hypothetical protein